MNAVSSLLGAIWRTLRSPKWIAAVGDDEARAMQLAAAVATALAGSAAPTLAALNRELNRSWRDVRIRDQRSAGASYQLLAKRHRLSTRQVRRIVDGRDG